MPNQKIWIIDNKKEEAFLREKTAEFDFSKHTKKEVAELVRTMREAMHKANGIGLSANQIGIPYRVFVAQVPDAQGHMKFYSMFNPKIEKPSSETETLEEGCLSIPETFGPVERAYRLTLSAQEKTGKKVKIKAWGLLARVFQHEVDHLGGTLFIDRAKSTQKITDKNR